MLRFVIGLRNQITASAAAIAVGLVLYWTPFGDPLNRLSYDLSFCFRGQLTTPEIVLVYLDEASAQELGQPLDAAWDRALHTRLLNRLTSEGARAVLYDIVFASPSPTAHVDDDFARAIRGHGTVILGAAIEVDQQQGIGQEVVIAPLPPFREAAAGWGLVVFEPEADFGVRKLSGGSSGHPSACRIAAGLLGYVHQTTKTQWLNYYGPADSIAGVSFAQALDGVPSGFFKDKLVVIGGRPSVAQLNLGKDEFAGPWSRRGGRFLSGMEIHATALLNLLRHDWLERLSAWAEIALLIVIGLFAGVILNRYRPIGATLIGIGSMIAIIAAALASVWWQRVWTAWLIPIAVQIPLGIVWSVGAQFFAETRRRSALRRAFSLYLSPHMADKIAASEFDLTPGGKLVEATIVFTDLQGFTSLSEELDDPAKLSEVLIKYFSRTTACILHGEGTIIKYMGDAIEAVWGAPLFEQDHAYKAALAAYRLREVSRFDALGRTFCTRVGISSGPAFAGNLGSEFRFDYAVIGDTTNAAARLESLNKQFGTDILISDSTLAGLDGRFITRPLGRYKVAGKSRSLGIHELIAPLESGPAPAWLSVFIEGLRAFESGAFQVAKARLEETRILRKGADGPSEFLLRAIQEFEQKGGPQEWDGVIEFGTK